jgi:hypothetical protein
MKKLLLLFTAVIAFACQTEDQISVNKPLTSKNSKTPNAHVRTTSNGRIGGHTFWYFYRSVDHTYLRSAYSDDGLSWGGNTVFNNGAGSSTSPAVAYFNNKFVCVFKGGSTTNIYYSTSTDGLTWGSYAQIPNISTAFSPTAVVYDNKLWIFYHGENLDNIYYITSTDGTTWSGQKNLGLTQDDQTYRPVTAAVDESTNSLYVFYPAKYASDQIRYKKLNNNIWSSFGSLYTSQNTALRTTTSVGAAFVNGTLYLAYKSDDGGNLNVFVGNPLSFGNVYFTGARSDHGPSMVYFNGKFTLVCKGLSSTNIYYLNSVNGINWSIPTVAIGQTTNGGARLIAG